MVSLATGPGLAGLVLLIVLFGSSVATNAIAWSWQLRALGQPHRLRTCLAILASTQFGKYMPGNRSEEHTSELPSLMRISYAVFCLKKNKTILTNAYHVCHPQM